MELGWIDFSKGDRNKVLGVLDLLMVDGTLDELGIAPIRDGFSNLFFPGTSTIQTRAKYFLIVPYALKDIEHNNETNVNRCRKILDEIERDCAEQLMHADKSEEGIIGSRSLRQGSWVKNTPAYIYWSGLRSYGIISARKMTLNEYFRSVCVLKQEKGDLQKLGNRHDESEEKDSDDKGAGNSFKVQLLNIPTYNPEWREDLSIRLSEAEGAFLKTQIIRSFPDSMMSFILKNDMTEILSCGGIKDLKSLSRRFPEHIQTDYKLAVDFSDFLYILRVLYNIIVSDGRNEEAIVEWKSIEKGKFNERAALDLEAIFDRVGAGAITGLCAFLRKCKQLMQYGDIEGLKREICRRERELKQSRAKTAHPGEVDASVWYGGKELDYRFNKAITIIRDIWESEGLC